jgi:hypothetical protein
MGRPSRAQGTVEPVVALRRWAARRLRWRTGVIAAVVLVLIAVALYQPRNVPLLAPGVHHAPPRAPLQGVSIQEAQPYVGFHLRMPPAPAGMRHANVHLSVVPGTFFSKASTGQNGVPGFSARTSYIAFAIQVPHVLYQMTLKEEAGGATTVQTLVHRDVRTLVNPNGPYHREIVQRQVMWLHQSVVDQLIDVVAARHGVVYDLTVTNFGAPARLVIHYAEQYLWRIMSHG